MYKNMNMLKQELLIKEPEKIFSGREADELSDLELIMTMLSGQSKSRQKMIEIAHTILNTPRLLMSVRDMVASGVKQEIAERIQAAIELGRRYSIGEFRHRVISCPKDIFLEVRHYADRMQEQFIVIVLNGAHEVLDTFVATVGLVNKTMVHPREVFSDAIARRASAIAIAHNHPSGSLDPSDDDVNVTKRLKASGDILGIKVLDHLIFTDKEYYSFMEHGLLN